MKNGIELRPTYWASFSGGKDSLFMLKLILENPVQYPLDGIVHFQLEIDYPFIKNVVDLVEKDCKQRGIQFFRIKPRKSWDELYDKNGFPTRIARWCNSKYKLDCLRQLDNMMKAQGKRVVNYIGFCADEQKRFKEKLNERNGVKQIYPIAELGYTEDIILEWAKQVDVFDGYYKENTRCGCMYCPCMSIANMKYLAKKYPEHFEKMMALASSWEQKYEKEKGKPVSVFGKGSANDLKKRILSEIKFERAQMNLFDLVESGEINQDSIKDSIEGE